ncbi:MAG TPA: hypothetical protein VK588_12525, partial [Chitinophagaceae bacterium]|nr:hypothetical protein [Chitinophagaceae bacterium]
GIIRVADGLSDVAAYKKQLTDLAAGTEYRNAVAIQSELTKTEINQQQELSNQFTGFDEKWWTKKIAELNRNIKSAKTKQESQMNQRLLNYLGLVGYMNSSRALSTGDLTNAGTYISIFKMADPKNPDCSYLSAVYYMKKGDQQHSVASLNEAASLGYSEVSQLIYSPAFAPLHDDAGFKKVVSRVMENYSAK